MDARRTLLASVALALLHAAAIPGAPLPATCTDKLQTTPRFFQGDPRGGFPGDGSNYCCPTAISDSLMYLSTHGYPNLVRHSEADPLDTQIALIRELGSPAYMKTDPATGTDVGQACLGIERYVKARGYSCKTLTYQGWRPVPKALASTKTDDLPDLAEIERTIAEPRGAVWLNVGWYVRTANADEWKRTGGHWVAVVGYGTDGNRRDDRSILLIDNPATHSRDAVEGKSPTSEELSDVAIRLTETGRGRLTGTYTGLPREAAGMYKVSGKGIGLSKKVDAAFLDGAIELVLSPPGR